MRFITLLSLSAAALAAPPRTARLAAREEATPRCKCVPGASCWPSSTQWEQLNTKVDGQLIKNTPVAQSCYEGPDFSSAQCSVVSSSWPSQIFHSSNPIGRPMPFNVTCAPVADGQTPAPAEDCTLGQLPVYTVKATKEEHISEALSVARKHNLRLSVTSTGHDMLGRADGYGSLGIWLYHFRNGINFQSKYTASNRCTKSQWTKAAIQINGAYQWGDVYKVAKQNNVIVVGGGTPTVGAIGGWSNGGGHGPASRNYGLGADQVLEARVMLASGKVVTANHCENADLFKAIRGGGPGYGITLSATVKAHPNVKIVTVHHLTVTPKTGLSADDQRTTLLDAVALLMQFYPDLNAKGFAGLAYWGGGKPDYTQQMWSIGGTKSEAEKARKPVSDALSRASFASRINVKETWASYTDYWSFYDAESGINDPVGNTPLMNSRLIDPPAVKDLKKLRDTIDVLAGEPQEYTQNVAVMVSGGQVFKDASDKTSGLHPAWRKSPFVLITARGVPASGFPASVREAFAADVTNNKGMAAKRLAPNTGGYMNEGDASDPQWVDTFFGAQYPSHLQAKKKYDPSGAFYCPTCVGAEMFVNSKDGALCRK